MAKFKDSKDRDWLLEINVHSVQRVRKSLDIDLLDCLTPGSKTLEVLTRDPVALVDVLWLLSTPEPENHQNPLTDEDFGKAMAGDAIERATVAFLESLVAFCPNPRDRAALGMVVKKAAAAKELILEKRDENLEANLDEAIEKVVAEILAGD